MTAKTLGRLRHFGRDKRGASAIEFALLAPLMIGLYIGCVEISEGIAAYRKVTLTAGALANLAAQVTTISPADKDNYSPPQRRSCRPIRERRPSSCPVSRLTVRALQK